MKSYDKMPMWEIERKNPQNHWELITPLFFLISINKGVKVDVIKPDKPKSKICIFDIDDDFYRYSHAYHINNSDYTLCGVGSEEFGNYKTTKKITCPQCLEIIRECKSYKM